MLERGGAAQRETLLAILNDGLSELGLSLSARVCGQLIDYVELLQQWNRAYNLTAVVDPEQMVVRHLLDSLAVNPLIQGKRFIDVGSGAGVPGLILAMARTDAEFVLLDGNGKKTRFLFQARTHLGLTNVTEVQQRAENHVDMSGFAGVLSRGLASLSEMLMCTDHLLAPGGYFYALKGKYPQSELSHLPKNYTVEAVTRLAVPRLQEERHLVTIGRK